MTAHHASAADAISVYALTVAYLHNARISNLGLVSARGVEEEEVAPDIFYIWDREQHIAPLAICIYSEVGQTWKVELSSGETLTLRDQGDVWDFVKPEKSLPNGKRKNVARRRGGAGEC